MAEAVLGLNVGLAGASTQGVWIWSPAFPVWSPPPHHPGGETSETQWLWGDGQTQDQSPLLSLRTPLWGLC